MSLFPRIPVSPMFRGGASGAAASTGTRTVATTGKATGLGTLAGIASLFAFLEPANRLLNQGANTVAANALPDLGTVVRLAWTHPENRDYWRLVARTWGYDGDAFEDILRASVRWPTVDEILQGYLLNLFGGTDTYRFIDTNGQSRELTFEEFLRGAQVPKEFDAFFRLLTVRPVPLETAIRLARRYGEYVYTDPVSGSVIESEFPRSGDYFDLFKSSKKAEGLETKSDEVIFRAFQVHPGVDDIIRFAVREVYTPEIAARFGQYEDLPPVFLSEARKAGLSKEDATRFWAAHWELPSSEQGFEMLHRGVIDEDTLKLLLRARDVMPFWRDKLVQISYRPVRLVDIYRLYEQRVIPRIDPDNLTKETPLIQRFMARGYTFKDASDLAVWLDRTRPDPATEAAIKSIVSSFEDGLIDEQEFLDLLKELSLAKETEEFLVASAKTARNRNLIDIAVKRFSPLLRDGSASEQEFRNELRKYGLSESAINRLVDRIESEQADNQKGLTESQVLRLYGKNLIETDKEAVSLLIASGRTKNAASLLLKEAKQDRESGVDSVPFADMKTFLKGGLIDDDKFTAYCRAKGMPEWAISAYLTQSQNASNMPSEEA